MFRLGLNVLQRGVFERNFVVDEVPHKTAQSYFSLFQTHSSPQIFKSRSLSFTLRSPAVPPLFQRPRQWKLAILQPTDEDCLGHMLYFFRRNDVKFSRRVICSPRIEIVFGETKMRRNAYPSPITVFHIHLHPGIRPSYGYEIPVRVFRTIYAQFLIFLLVTSVELIRTPQCQKHFVVARAKGFWQFAFLLSFERCAAIDQQHLAIFWSPWQFSTPLLMFDSQIADMARIDNLSTCAQSPDLHHNMHFGNGHFGQRSHLRQHVDHASFPHHILSPSRIHCFRFPQLLPFNLCAIFAEDAGCGKCARSSAFESMAFLVILQGELFANADLRSPSIFSRPVRLSSAKASLFGQSHYAAVIPMPQSPVFKLFADSTLAITATRRMQRSGFNTLPQCVHVGFVLARSSAIKVFSRSRGGIFAWTARYAATRQRHAGVEEPTTTPIAAMKPLKAVQVLKEVSHLFSTLVLKKVSLHSGLRSLLVFHSVCDIQHLRITFAIVRSLTLLRQHLLEHFILLLIW